MGSQAKAEPRTANANRLMEVIHGPALFRLEPASGQFLRIFTGILDDDLQFLAQIRLRQAGGNSGQRMQRMTDG